MLDFTYYTPTKVFFGKDTQQRVGEIVAEYGFRRVMLQYGKSSIKKSGLYDEIMTSLQKSGITVVEMGGVEPNPKVDFVRRAAKLARDEQIELILAVGGGSVIDSAKTTALAAANEHDIFDMMMGKAKPTAALPVGCVLTHAAAGSEMSASAVLTNTELGVKKGIGTDLNRPLFSICNPELTFTLPAYQTACGVVDIMAHTMERYFTVCPPTDLTDRICESLLKSVISAARVLLREPRDYDARATVMWASSISHNGLTGCGRENALAVHQLEHAVSGMFDHVAHGAGLAVLFPAWASYVLPHNVPRLAQFARRVFDVEEGDDLAAAKAGIAAMSRFFTELGMPQHLSEFDIPKNALPALADLASFGGTRVVKSYVPLDRAAMLAIFEACY